MLVGIHDEPGGPSDVWIRWCAEHDVKFLRVDCFSTNIMQQLRDCDILFWWWDAQASRFAPGLIHAAELAGIRVFPPLASCWHVDDKIAQKYAFEALSIPLAPSYVFYDQQEALDWTRHATYPKVQKLRAGQASEAVWFVRSQRQAASTVRRAFRGGFVRHRRWRILRSRLSGLKRRRGLSELMSVVRGAVRVAVPSATDRSKACDSTYVYFQDYIHGAKVVFHVFTAMGRVFASKMTAREDDFRASGTTQIEHGHPGIVKEEVVRLVLDVAQTLDVPFLGIEVASTPSGLIIIETDAIRAIGQVFPGYWDRNLCWHGDPSVPAEFIIEQTLRDASSNG